MVVGGGGIVKHFQTLRYVNFYEILVPDDLTGKYLMGRISIWNSLLRRNKKDHFLLKNDNGRRKIVCENVTRKRSWKNEMSHRYSLATANLHSKKVMPCIRWPWKGIVHCKPFLQNQTLNADKYCLQLTLKHRLPRLKIALSLVST